MTCTIYSKLNNKSRSWPVPLCQKEHTKFAVDPNEECIEFDDKN